MRCLLTVPHDLDTCDDQCLKLCDRLEFGAIRFFEYENHEYVVFVPSCRIPIIGRSASKILWMTVDAMEQEINCKIIAQNEAIQICEEFKDKIDPEDYINNYSPRRNRKIGDLIPPVYSSGLPENPYQLFARRDVILWINGKINLSEIKKWAQDRSINNGQCEVCGERFPSTTLDFLWIKRQANPSRKTWRVCPRCKEEVLRQDEEEKKFNQAQEAFRKERERIRIGLIEANNALDQLTPKSREILECHDRENREHQARKEISQARRQFASLKHHLKENNLEALRLLAEELKPPPTSPT